MNVWPITRGPHCESTPWFRGLSPADKARVRRIREAPIAGEWVPCDGKRVLS